MTDRLRRIAAARLASDKAELAHLLLVLPTMKHPENVLWKIADLQQGIAFGQRALDRDRFENMEARA
jgi:hypothetical protein